MARRALRGTLITNDPATRDAVQGFVRERPEALAVTHDYSQPFSEFDAATVREIQEAAPGVLLVDLDQDPALGIALVRHLLDTAPELTVVAIGNAATTDLLLNAMRAGVAEFLPKPVTPEALGELVTRLRTRLERTLSSDDTAAQGQIHVFFSAKGGVGSTTCAINYAIELHRRTGRSTLLVDLEPELGETSLMLGMSPKFNFVDLIRNFHRMDTGLLGSYLERHSSGVHLLSAPLQPDAVPTLSEEQIRRILSYLRGQYDYIVVDTAKSFGPPTLAAFEAADRVFILATVDLPSLRNVQRVMPLIRRVTPAGDQHTHVVINRFDPSGDVRIEDIEKSLQTPVFATLANDYDAVITSINSSKPVILNAKSAYARSIRRLVDQVLGESDGVPEQKGGLLSRLTGAFRAPAAAKERKS